MKVFVEIVRRVNDIVEIEIDDKFKSLTVKDAKNLPEFDDLINEAIDTVEHQLKIPFGDAWCDQEYFVSAYDKQSNELFRY